MQLDIYLIDVEKFVNLTSVKNAQTFMMKINNLYVNDLMIEIVIDNEISSQYVDYKNVFSEEKANTLIEHDSQNHVIDINDQKSLFDSMYNLSVTELEVLRKYIDEHLEKRFITSFISSADASILFVKKSSEELRLCVNYRDLNAITVKNRYFLLLINETLNRLSRFKIFIKLDIRVAYNQIRIKEDDE